MNNYPSSNMNQPSGQSPWGAQQGGGQYPQQGQPWQNAPQQGYQQGAPQQGWGQQGYQQNAPQQGWGQQGAPQQAAWGNDNTPPF